MASFFKKLSTLLGSGAAPTLHLAAFGKHPGWNDHADDLGLDTDTLVTAKRLLYVQGISQNIDSGAWEKLEPTPAGAPVAEGRLDSFRHDFLRSAGPANLLAGRLRSSVDGKGRDKYPMVLCAHLADVSAAPRVATTLVLPDLALIHEKIASATSANTVRELLAGERDTLRSRILEKMEPLPLSSRELTAIANHPDMHPGKEGFHRIAYQFASGLAAYRPGAKSTTMPRRPEQLRVPTCGLATQEALFFWLRFALTFIDPATSLLLLAPDQGPYAPWVDVIAGEPAPSNLFCIKAGTKALPLPSDIPYTLDPSFARAVDATLSAAASAPEGAPAPAWQV